MKDYYLNVATAKKAAFLNELPAKIKAAFDDKYYQDEDIIIDWIGKVPNTTAPVTGDVLTWKAGQHFNIRVLNPAFEDKVERFINATRFTPVIPYRMFG